MTAVLRPSRVARPALLIAAAILLAQIAMIPFHWSTGNSTFQNLAPGDFHGLNFDAGPCDYVLWCIYPNPAWREPGEMHRYGIWGVQFGRRPGLCWYAYVSFVWTIGLNVLAVLWLGRGMIAWLWRNRPRLPRVRLTIEWRPRFSA